MSPLAVALALASALLSRRLPVLAVALGIQLGGLAIALLAIVAAGEPIPAPLALAWAGLTGLSGGAGLALLYRALAEGQMSRVAPIVGLLAAGVPVLAGLALGDRLDAPRAAGIAAGLVAIAAVARSGGPAAGVPAMPRRGLVTAALAGLGLGLAYVTLDRAAAVDGATWWLLVGVRLGALAVFPVAGALLRQPVLPARRDLPLLLAVGAVDLGGTAFFVLANALAPLGPTAVLSALYPAVTVLLALALLRERLAPLQVAGLGLAAAGVVLFAWP